MTLLPMLSPGLRAVASTQRGVFTAGQAYASGHTQKELQRLRQAKLIMSLRRGVYVDMVAWANADSVERLRLRTAGLALALTAPAVLSHQSAAAELGLPLLAPDHTLMHVTRENRAGTRLEAGVDHHVAELHDHEVVDLIGGIMPVTSAARTAVDVARETDRFECAVAAFDSALRHGATREALAAAMDRARSWPGARLASGALPLADGRADNPGESWSRVVLIGLGLPPDDLQVRLVDDQGLIGYVDFGWDDVIGEFDGKLKYGVDGETDPCKAGRIVFAEKRREDRIRRLGYGVARWGWAELHRPAIIGRRVHEARASSGRRRRKAG
jgi:hypothetical protein